RRAARGAPPVRRPGHADPRPPRARRVRRRVDPRRAVLRHGVRRGHRGHERAAGAARHARGAAADRRRADRGAGGDPRGRLADLGYLTITWIERDDPGDTMYSSMAAVTRGEGFHSRDELISAYEERTGRSMSDLRWYQALALWKAAVFMEGNYKRSLAGTTD